jgi:hypothetical protein
MKHLKYILILALSSAMGTLQAQDLKELMKENRENREANYAKWGPTSDHDGMGYVVRAGFVLGGTTPLPLPKEIRKINEFAPKGGFSLVLQYEMGTFRRTSFFHARHAHGG